jgi:hypothetical protein
MQRNKKDKSEGIIRIDTRSRWFNLFVIGLCFFFLLAVRLQTNTATTGDEPHYLLMDYSLVHDHDLNLSNNFANKDYGTFYLFGNLLPQGAPKRAGSINVLYEPHGIGLPVFLLPGFYLTAKNGAVFEMIVLGTVIIWLTWVWTKLITKNRMLAYIASASLVVCYFFNGLVGYIYPDVLIAALILITLIILEKYYTQPRFQVLMGFTLGFLILVHFKTLDFVLPALAVLGYKLWRSEHKLPWSTTLITLAFIIYYFITYHQWFGVPISAAFGAGGANFGVNPLTNISAMLFDTNRGLLVFNPILLLIFIGIPLWLKRHLESLFVTAITLLPSIVVLSVFVQWNGGYAPNGRYIIEFLPAIIPAIAFAVESLYRSWQRVLVFLLAAISFLISLDFALRQFPLLDPNLYKIRSPLFIQIQQHTGLAIDRLLPSYSTTPANITLLVSHHGFIKLAANYLLVVVLIVYGYYLSRSIPPKRLSLK